MTKKMLIAMGVLAAAGAVAAQQPGPRPEPGRHGRGGPDPARLQQALGLTEAQTEQLKKAWDDQARAGIRRRADMQIARMDLHNLLGAATVDEKAVNAKVAQIGELQLAQLRAQVDGRLALRKILTAEQLKKSQQLRPQAWAGGGQWGRAERTRGRFGAPGAPGVPQPPPPPDEE
jgi:Spy/CpxP family protein refolding chaperone